MNPNSNITSSSELVVARYRHPHGIFDPADPYLEIVWLPIIGPASVVITKFLHRWLHTTPAAAIEVADLGAHCGLGAGTANNSATNRTMQRLDKFGLAQHEPDAGTFQIPELIPPVDSRHIRRLPHLAAAHHHDTIRRLITTTANGIGA